MHGTPDITPEFIARLAAELGGRVVVLYPESEHRKETAIELDSPMLRLYVRHSWEARPKWRAYVMDYQGRSIHNSGSANFSSTRSIEDIAADLRRRVIDPSREPLRVHLLARLGDSAKATAVRQRRAELHDMLSDGQQRYHHGQGVYLPGVRIDHEYCLEPGREVTATISVKRWETFRLICTLIAADRLLPS